MYLHTVCSLKYSQLHFLDVVHIVVDMDANVIVYGGKSKSAILLNCSLPTPSVFVFCQLPCRYLMVSFTFRMCRMKPQLQTGYLLWSGLIRVCLCVSLRLCMCACPHVCLFGGCAASEGKLLWLCGSNWTGMVCLIELLCPDVSL